MTIVSELGQISRFAGARQLMGYSGAVASEDSSGKRVQRGTITKTGNAHLRRVVIEAAWACRHRPAVGATLHKRQRGVSAEVKEIAWKAQHRLHKRFYEKVIKVKADVAALRWASFFSSWSSVGGIQQRPSKIIFPISNPLYSICVFPDCGPQNID